MSARSQNVGTVDRTSLAKDGSLPRTLLFVCLMLVLCLSGLAQAQDPEFIIMTNDGTNNNNLYRMPLGSTQAANISPVSWSGIIWELTSGPNMMVYGLDRGTDTLVTISPSQGSIISSISLDADMWNNGRGLSTAPDGTLYGIFNRWDLRTINPSTGQTTHVADITGISGGVEAMAFADNGTLYVAAAPNTWPWGSHLYTLNPSTGQVALINRIGSSHIDIDTMAYASDGFLYGADTRDVSGTDLYKIDPSNGSKTLVTQLPGGVNGLHFGVISEPATLVAIDIKPGSEQNPVNLKSNGVLPVAVLGTEEFDVMDIDLGSLTLDGVTPREKGNSGKTGSFEDINSDSFTDLMLHFEISELDILSDATELILEGLLNDGTALTGSDSIRIVPPGDVDGDGLVGGQDLSVILNNWGVGNRVYEQGDLDGDGFVGAADYQQVLSHWGQSSPTEGPAAIPEPATLGFLVMGGLALLRSRRRFHPSQ